MDDVISIINIYASYDESSSKEVKKSKKYVKAKASLSVSDVLHSCCYCLNVLNIEIDRSSISMYGMHTRYLCHRCIVKFLKNS